MSDKQHLASLRDNLTEAEGNADALNRFRAFVKLEHEVAFLVKRAASERGRLDSKVRQVKEEQLFLNRHRMKVRKVTSLMERVYRFPDKAFRTMEVLFRHYGPDELLDIVQANPAELGAMFGYDFWIFQTPLRRRAHMNFTRWVMPATREIVADHREFLKSDQVDWDDRLEKADNKARAAAALFAEADLLRIRLEMGKLKAAQATTDEDRARMSKVEVRNVEVLQAKAQQSNEKLMLDQSRAQALRDANTDDAASSVNDMTASTKAEETQKETAQPPADPLAGIVPETPAPSAPVSGPLSTSGPEAEGKDAGVAA